MKILILGGSHAALALAAELRSQSADGEITIISADVELPYQRPPLSKAFMSGKASFEQILLRPEDWYAANHITLLRGLRATAIDRQSRLVMLSDGTTHAYDRLALATGAKPRRLPAAIGGELPNVHVMRDLADATGLMAKMAEGRRLVVIGGGYIGLEAASEAAKKGVSVTVIEAADRILKRVACGETANDIRALHRSHGVDIREATGIVAITESGGAATGVELATGEMIPADFIITGIGVSPDTELAEAAGLVTANGIAVNDLLETSDPSIFAIGDCASFPYHGNPIRLESVQNANDMGIAAARTMLGTPTHYNPVPWFWSDQFDLKLQIAGLNTGYDQVVSRDGARPGARSHFYFRDGAFLAADCLNDGASYMIARRVLEGGKTFTPEQAADPAFVLKSLLT